MGQLLRHVVPSYVVGSGHGRRTQGITRSPFRAGGGFARSSFFVAFRDLGAGVVDTMEGRGQVTPTFTRATTKWTKLASGLWGSVATGTACSVYLGANTAVGAYGGYFAEGAATNLALQNRDMTQAAWVSLNITSAKTGTGIDGVVNGGSRLTCTSNGGTVLQVLVAGAAGRTYSAWIRRVTGTGAISLFQGATTSDITAQINSTTYTRVALSASVDVSVLGYGIIMATSGDVIEIDMNGYETGTFATSPIPTTVAAVTRNADVLTYPTAPWLNASAGTIFAQGTPGNIVSASVQALVELGDGTANEAIALQQQAGAGTTAGYQITDGGVSQAALTIAVAFATGVTQKTAGAYALNDAIFAAGGVLSSADTSVTLPTVDRVNVGFTALGSNSFFGAIGKIAYFPQRLSNSQIQALTS